MDGDIPVIKAEEIKLWKNSELIADFTCVDESDCLHSAALCDVVC